MERWCLVAGGACWVSGCVVVVSLCVCVRYPMYVCVCVYVYVCVCVYSKDRVLVEMLEYKINARMWVSV